MLFETLELRVVLVLKLTVFILESDHVLVAFLILKGKRILLIIFLLEFPIGFDNVVLRELTKYLELIEKTSLTVHKGLLLLQLLS